MGTHLRVLTKSYPMNTNVPGFSGFSKTWTKLASELEGLIEAEMYRVLWKESVPCWDDEGCLKENWIGLPEINVQQTVAEDSNTGGHL